MHYSMTRRENILAGSLSLGQVAGMKLKPKATNFNLLFGNISFFSKCTLIYMFVQLISPIKRHPHKTINL